MPQTDEAIVALVQHGAKDAFGELVDRYEPKLKRYVRRFLSRKEDIDDIVQDVFIRAYTNIQSCKPELRFSPWIYRIAHNTSVNALKAKDRLSMTLFDTDTILPYAIAPETADQYALDEELKKDIDLILAQLSPKYREVIILHDLELFSYQDMSTMLHIPVTTVGVRLARARKKMQELYKIRSAATHSKK